MLRIYKYSSPYEFKDFETHLFSTLRPVFDHPNDKIILDGQEYRISTINYLGLFNRLIDNLPAYTLSLANNDETFAVFFHNTNFILNINPRPGGSIINLKIRKTTENDITISLPEGSYGKNIVDNQLVLSSIANTVFILTAIYENGEYDWTDRTRAEGYSSGSSTVSWNEIDGIPTEFVPAAHNHDGIYSLVNHTHDQLHDQNTDTQIVYQEPTIPTYVFGALGNTPIAIKELTLNFEGADKFISEVVPVNIFGADYFEVYEDGLLKQSQACSFALIDGRYRFYLNDPFKALAGKSYQLKFRRTDNTAFSATFSVSSTYYEQGIPYNPVVFDCDFIRSDDTVVNGYNETPIYFLRGSNYSKVETGGTDLKIIAGQVFINGKDHDIYHDARYSLLGHVHDYAAINHNHDSVYSALNHLHDARYSQLGHTHDYAATNHNHNGIYEPVFSKNTAFNKNFGSVAGSVSEGNHNHDARYSQLGHTHDYAATNHNHSGIYEPVFSKNTAFNKNFETSTANIKMNGAVSVGTSANIARTDHVHPVDTSRASASHNHSGVYEPAFSKNTAFNKNFGSVAGTVSEGNHNHDARYSLLSHTHSNYIDTSSTAQTKAGALTVKNQTISDTANPALYLNLSGARKGTVYYDNTGGFVMLHNNAQDNGLKIYDLDGRGVLGGKLYASDFEQTSDVRLKKNIEPLHKGIEGLKPVSFEYKHIKGKHYGFIAQDMLKTHPELVDEGFDGFYSIKQNSIIALLVKEVSELKQKLKELSCRCH